jgi:hypothetical protein
LARATPSRLDDSSKHQIGRLRQESKASTTP